MLDRSVIALFLLVDGKPYVVGNAWDLMGPDVLLLQGMMRVALRQKVLEEAHVLETEQRNLVMRLDTRLSVGTDVQPCLLRT